MIRNFKGYTSRKLLKAIGENLQEKEWLLWMFSHAEKKTGNVKKMQFWQQSNKPIEIWPLKFEQKLYYVHHNPVESGFVLNPVDWKFSIARNYANATILFWRLIGIDCERARRSRQLGGMFQENWLAKKKPVIKITVSHIKMCGKP